MRLCAGAASVLLMLAGASCGGSPPPGSADSASSDAPASTAVPRPYSGYPDSIVVLGHSGSTGESSDPTKPVGDETRANSWVTGTNPQVNSLYLRILAQNPAIRDHNLSMSQGGATVDEALGQAQQALVHPPTNALVVIQLVDNDIVCPATQADYDAFQTGLEAVLRELDTGLPTSRIFVVSHYGTPRKDFAALTPDQRRQQGGSGPCDFINPRGKLVPAELRRLERIVDGLESALQAGCAKFDRCHYDDDAFHNAPVLAEYTSPIDLNHFSIAGHAKAADVAWQAITRAQLAPAPG